MEPSCNAAAVGRAPAAHRQRLGGFVCTERDAWRRGGGGFRVAPGGDCSCRRDDFEAKGRTSTSVLFNYDTNKIIALKTGQDLV